VYKFPGFLAPSGPFGGILLVSQRTHGGSTSFFFSSFSFPAPLCYLGSSSKLTQFPNTWIRVCFERTQLKQGHKFLLPQSCTHTHTHTHTHTEEYYSALKKKEILSFATTWINMEDIILSEISQAQKNYYCMISLMCRI
jgi:hypothetical protein